MLLPRVLLGSIPISMVGIAILLSIALQPKNKSLSNGPCVHVVPTGHIWSANVSMTEPIVFNADIARTLLAVSFKAITLHAVCEEPYIVTRYLGGLRFRPPSNFCALFFADETAVPTIAYEAMFVCPEWPAHAGFHCINAYSIYDYCITWDDISRVGACTLFVHTNTPIIVYTSTIPVEIPEVGDILPTYTLLITDYTQLCITSNTTSRVVSILRTSGSYTLMPHASHTCYAISPPETVVLVGFYANDTAWVQ